MKTRILTSHYSHEDKRYSVYYDLLDDAGNVVKASAVAFVQPSQAVLDAVLAESASLLGADLDALALPKNTAPQAVTDAVAQIGLARDEAERVRAKSQEDKATADKALAETNAAIAQAKADHAAAVKAAADAQAAVPAQATQ